jgi:hypothetical protein
MNRIIVLVTVLLAVTLALAAPKKPVSLPDMSGPTTCVSLYELQPDGSQVLVGISESPSFKGDPKDLPGLMDVHLRHAFQFIGRTHGRSEKWLADRDAAPILLNDGPIYSPAYLPRPVGDGSAACWCATPTRDPVTKAITGCEFPCGACEYCVVKP